MWTVVFVSRNKSKVDMLLAKLGNNKIMTMSKLSGEDDFSEGTTYEILVPQTELEAAQEVIFDTEIELSK